MTDDPSGGRTPEEYAAGAEKFLRILGPIRPRTHAEGQGMSDEELASRITETLCAAQRRWRQSLRFGALVTPPIPEGLIDQAARGLVPVLRALVRDALAAEQLQS